MTFLSELARLYRTGAIDSAAYTGYVSSFNAALATEKRLRGTRKTELESVTETMHQIAVSHQLTPSRLPALFATLAANQQWWTQGPLLSSGQRVEFTGSQLVWEYYPGQGIQLQVLGSFGKADGLYTGGVADYPAMEQLLSELIPLAAQRGGGLAWEYYFNFDGGSPPWTSAMSQATGLEALTRAYQATGNAYYLTVATQALPVFTKAPPVGVSLKTPAGTRFLQYTFAPTTAIINAFLQTLIGLDDFAHVERQPDRRRPVRGGECRGRGRGPGVRHRRLVAVPAGDRGHAQLPRAGHGLPAAAVHADRGARLLRHRAALPVLPDHPPGPDAAHAPRADARRFRRFASGCRSTRTWGWS